VDVGFGVNINGSDLLNIALQKFIPGFNMAAQYFKQLNNCRSWAVSNTSRNTFAPNCTKYNPSMIFGFAKSSEVLSVVLSLPK
jgi:hypothetical protein